MGRDSYDNLEKLFYKKVEYPFPPQKGDKVALGGKHYEVDCSIFDTDTKVVAVLLLPLETS